MHAGRDHTGRCRWAGLGSTMGHPGLMTWMWAAFRDQGSINEHRYPASWLPRADTASQCKSLSLYLSFSLSLSVSLRSIYLLSAFDFFQSTIRVYHSWCFDPDAEFFIRCSWPLSYQLSVFLCLHTCTCPLTSLPAWLWGLHSALCGLPTLSP